jgi:hypothetical protein
VKGFDDGEGTVSGEFADGGFIAFDKEHVLRSIIDDA